MESISQQMASLLDLRRQVDQIDRQIVELLARRQGLVRQVVAQRKDDEPDIDREQQVLSNWLEEAFDYELEEAAMEKISKAVIDMGRKAREA